ncbi:MAG: flagellar M-ring protein FliF [Spirochaetales bacterium]|nr:flagellar M-ring protein FliF [Spirochaetales bacterium]
MNEFFKKMMEQIKTIWAKWSTVQKVIFFSVIGVVLIAIVLLLSFSSRPTMVRLYQVPIKDDNLLARITTRLDEEFPGDYELTTDNIIQVRDPKKAQRMRSLLVSEDLVPEDSDPWDLFDVERWTLTDFDRKINLRRSITRNLEQHIMALDDIDAVSVVVDMPENELFQADQKPFTASVQLTAKPGVDLHEERYKVEGIERLIMSSISGLTHENLVITDQYGLQLNDFENYAEQDRLDLISREMALKEKLERKYHGEIIKSLGNIFTPDRVSIPKLEIELDTSKESSTLKEIIPVTLRSDDPKTPYSELEIKDNIVRSKQTSAESFKGTGFTPEGPPGQEGQVPPAYKDLSTLVGQYDQNSETTNYEVGEKNTERQEQPYKIKRLTIGINVDGYWEKHYDSKGEIMFEENNPSKVKRSYVPVDGETLRKVQRLIEDSIGADPARGDSVTVEHIPVDRRALFEAEDAKYRQGRQMAQTVFWILIGLGIVIFMAVVLRMLSKYIERKRREKEEELARQHQAMREAALKSAEEQGMDVELTVEERARMEMQENAINMAREHPEDVAQLIRTWLMEE